MLTGGYGHDSRVSVVVEVARRHGVSVFDIPVVRKSLSEGDGIPYALKGFVKDLHGLANWPTVKKLDLSGCNEITELGPLAGLQGLEMLNLSMCAAIRHLVPLEALKKYGDSYFRNAMGSRTSPRLEHCKIWSR
jgi:hypothetical protein